MGLRTVDGAKHSMRHILVVDTIFWAPLRARGLKFDAKLGNVELHYQDKK